MELTEITREQWETAVDASILHCEDGVHQTKESYRKYNNDSSACALCQLFERGEEFHKHCPIYDDNRCCAEWYAGYQARNTNNFPAFHNAYILLVKRLKAVREHGYEAWRAEHSPKEHVWKDGDYARWDGTDGEGNSLISYLSPHNSDNRIVRLEISDGHFNWGVNHPLTNKHIFWVTELALSPTPADYKPPERRGGVIDRRKH